MYIFIIKWGISPQLAQSIAWAESRFILNARNPVGTASGVYQFLDSTFKSYCINLYELASSMDQKNDVIIQVECALRIMKEDSKGTGHWYPSEHNWSKYVPLSEE